MELVGVADSGNTESQTFVSVIHGEQRMWGDSVVEDTDGSIIVCGRIQSDGNTQTDIVLIRLDPTGKRLWLKTYPRTGYESPKKVVVDMLGNIIIVGSLRGEDFSSDGFLMKTDAAGNLQWLRTYGGDGYDTFDSLDRTADGSFILVGSSNSWMKAYIGNDGSINTPCRPYLVKTDCDGNPRWERWFYCHELNNLPSFPYHFYGSVYATDVKQARDGGYIITGGLSYEPRFILKTNCHGFQEWLGINNLDHGANYMRGAANIIETPDGNYISGGSYETQFEDVRLYLWAVDPQGTTLWEKLDDPAYPYSSPSVCHTSDGGFAIAHGDDLNRYDDAGDGLWQRNYSNLIVPCNSLEFSEINVTEDGCFLLCGYRSYTYANSNYWKDIVVIRTSPSGRVQAYGSDISFSVP